MKGFTLSYTLMTARNDAKNLGNESWTPGQRTVSSKLRRLEFPLIKDSQQHHS